MGKKLLFRILLAIGMVFTAYHYNASLKFTDSSDGTDVWQYQTVAVNLAVYGKHPVMGFLGDESVYALDELPTSAIEGYIKCRFTENGPVTYLEKPPAYPLLLGMVYKLFNPDLHIAYYLNLFLFGGILLVMMFIGSSLNKKHGFLMGLLAAVIYAFGYYHRPSDVLPSTMMTFLFSCITLVYILLVKSPSVKHFCLMGVLLALGFLTKGDINFLMVLIPLSLLLVFWGIRRVGLKFLYMFISMVLVLMPWTIYVNNVRVNSVEERAAWAKHVRETEALCEIDASEDEDWENRSSIIKNGEHHALVTHLFEPMAAAADKFIIVTSQGAIDEVLSVHNEYNADGHYHPEWRVRGNSIYNTQYLDSSVPAKIMRFYIDNPAFFVKTCIAKLIRTTSLPTFSYFLFSAFLFGCLGWLSIISMEKNAAKWFFLLISIGIYFTLLKLSYPVLVVFSLMFFVSGVLLSLKFLKAIPLIFPLFILNSFMIVLLFYGDTRFISVIAPITVFSTLYFLYLLIRTILNKEKISELDFTND